MLARPVRGHALTDLKLGTTHDVIGDVAFIYGR